MHVLSIILLVTAVTILMLYYIPVLSVSVGSPPIAFTPIDLKDIIDVTAKKLARVVARLQEVNTSGQLQPDSSYKPYLDQGYIEFTDGKWALTDKGRKIVGGGGGGGDQKSPDVQKPPDGKKPVNDGKPVPINWGGVTVTGLEQIPPNVTVYDKSADGSSLKVGVNSSTSDGNQGETDRPRAELSIPKGSSYISSTSYNLHVNGRSADNKTAHVTQIKGKGATIPALTVSVGNPKGNTSSHGYLAVMSYDETPQWVNKNGGLSPTFDLEKAVPANQSNRIDIRLDSTDTAALMVNGKPVTTVSGIDNNNLKFGAYGGSSTLDSSGIVATFSNITAAAR
jgi:hypothetical protein